MRVLRKVNNNVVMCVDADGREVIALGRGLGFKKLRAARTIPDHLGARHRGGAQLDDARHARFIHAQ